MHVPAQYAHLTELANEGVGGFALYATDDFFAGKENLLAKSEPVFIADKYTDLGKWMDGWESQRRRTEGHDWAIVRLGLPGEIHGVVVDTTHFKGNAPAEVALEGAEAPGATIEQLLGTEAGGVTPTWVEVLPRSKVKPDSKNVFDLTQRRRLTHLRLRIYPDGGVARLRVFGKVLPEPRTFWRPGSIDLVAVENGGTVVQVSDRFFGPPANLLLPGRGVNMGDGWETARRRTPGSDWAVLQLGRPGVIERIELDTHFFKGNAPQAVRMEALDLRALPPAHTEALFAGDEGWTPLLEKTPTEQHRRHQLYPDRRRVVTHVRVHIYPHGGVNRLRLFGEPIDSESDVTRLAQLHALSTEDAKATFLAFNGAPAFAEQMASRRPYPTVRALFAAADEVWWSLSEAEVLAAFAAHPKIGEKKAAPVQNAQSAAWSAGEQAQASRGNEDVLAELTKQNARYQSKFGFIYICFATGKSATEMLAWLNERIERDRAQEIETAAGEQAKITRLRIEKWLQA
jgi:allantoicase